jgi:predicted metal-dependent phosphoesterase TrpH
MTIDCLAHVHSSFSYDSRTDLADIAATARRHEFRAVLMSEHNNRLNDEQVAAFVKRCDELSDDRLLIVPGLELAFDSNRVHLLAYGIRTYIDSMHEGCTFQELVRATREAGGLAVLAHPSHKQAVERLSPDDLRQVDGVEIWNVKNGNRFVPTASDVRLLQRLRSADGRQFGYGGVDWHHLVNFTPLALEVDTGEVSWPALREALRNGRFRIRGRFAAIGASGETGRGRVALYHLAASGLARTRRAAYRWQHQLERRGFKTPKFVTAIARRLF